MKTKYILLIVIIILLTASILFLVDKDRQERKYFTYYYVNVEQPVDFVKVDFSKSKQRRNRVSHYDNNETWSTMGEGFSLNEQNKGKGYSSNTSTTSRNLNSINAINRNKNEFLVSSNMNYMIYPYLGRIKSTQHGSTTDNMLFASNYTPPPLYRTTTDGDGPDFGGGDGGPDIGPGTGTDNPGGYNDVPMGNGLMILLMLSLIYSFIKRIKNKKQAVNVQSTTTSSAISFFTSKNQIPNK